MSKICIYCGAELEDEALYCDECGKKQESQVESTEQNADTINSSVEMSANSFNEDNQHKLELEKSMIEQNKLALEKSIQEAELIKQQNEKARLEQENLKRDAEVKKEQEAIRRQEKRELELEQAKVEQNKLAIERATREAELIKQQNEKVRLEQELLEKRELAEKKRLEEEARTFNGVLYDTVEEMKNAKTAFENQQTILHKQKKINAMSISSLILAIAAFPLVTTLILWFPSLIASIVLGIKAIKEKTEKRRCVIAALAIDGLFILMVVYSVIYTL